MYFDSGLLTLKTFSIMNLLLKIISVMFKILEFFFIFFFNWKKKKRLVWKIQVNPTWPITQLTHLKMTYFYLQPNWPNPFVLPRLISAHHQSLIVPCFNSELSNANFKALSISLKSNCSTSSVPNSSMFQFRTIQCKF